jgi:hypothetical protein
VEGCWVKIEPILKKNGLFCFFLYDLRKRIYAMLYALWDLSLTPYNLCLTVGNLTFKFWLEERTPEQLKGEVG